MTEAEIDYTLKVINDAIRENVWHTVTPQYLADLKRRSKERRKNKKNVTNLKGHYVLNIPYNVK